ncbi:MAG: hypothetical protein C4520_08765 [Candidatus Abyssobacteria bacterium SURF_5]|uniref:DUF364 domain-containing protein n=1 Tax=Abyssobacteria bacterium (strain SURF_5) TaxID=2093360 RepID=A0A3A4NNV5_ABYX5|nr:MAG: hypothetical protein C4520_08765 [Candidatus Abyssubacteria bacterium SURF_5]
MKVIDDLISTIREDSAVRQVNTCIFWTSVISRHCGLASTIREAGSHHGSYPVKEAGSLTAKTALELAQMAYSSSVAEASIGMAAINSLIDIDLSRCEEKNAFEILRRRGTGKKIVIVGHFPFVSKLKETAERLWVLEKQPQEGDLAEEEAERILPQADVVGMSGTVLINHSFERLMPLCRGRFVVMLGPSTPLAPVLFEHGVDVVSGVKVTEPDTVIRMISEGASFKQLQGVQLLTMTRGTTG